MPQHRLGLNWKLVDGKAVYFEHDTTPRVQLRSRPDPDCDRCGFAQQHGQVIYCSCMVIRPEKKHKGN